MFHLALIVYAFILGAGHYLRTLDIRRREQLRAERLRADLASAQLRALTLQLQPHFLFNALNAVGALIITERNREAFEVVGRLGELLRALLAIDRREEVSLREEIELAEAYVAIEQARLGDRLRVTSGYRRRYHERAAPADAAAAARRERGPARRVEGAGRREPNDSCGA